MNIHKIDSDDLGLLIDFLKNDIPKSFRYFNSRDIDCIKNHIITLVATSDNVPIGYAHLDKDGDNIWLGICILKEHQGNNYGNNILDFLLSYIKKNSLQNVRLAVDIDNYRAINLYMKHNFKIMNFCDTYYILKLDDIGNTLTLPVSLGEALDKLTILEIKLDKIKDDRKKDVQKEHDVLRKKLVEYIDKNNVHYDILKKINLSIWELQDKFRYGNSTDKDEICMEIIEENDRRFRVKNKINVRTDSELKEQKGYKPKRAMVLGHLGLGDNLHTVGMVRYLSTIYDEVIVICKKDNEKNIKQIYSDDPVIRVLSVLCDRDISPAYGADPQKFNKIFRNHKKYLMGFHKHGLRAVYGPGKQMYDLPFSFYDDVKISHSVFWDYFHVNKPEESTEMHVSLEKNGITDYIFMHNTASGGEVFTFDFITKKYNIDKNETLVVNPCTCMYEPGDKYYDIAKSLTDKPILTYMDLIGNASMVVMSDSSFACLAWHIEMKTDKCFIYCRVDSAHNFAYGHIWSDKYKSKNDKLKKFIQIN